MTSAAPFFLMAAAKTAAVPQASEPAKAGSSSRMAFFTPRAMASFKASVAFSGPTVTTVTSPPKRSSSSRPSSTANSSQGLSTSVALMSPLTASAALILGSSAVSGVCLTHTTKFKVSPPCDLSTGYPNAS
jgi:hypothetical protein